MVDWIGAGLFLLGSLRLDFSGGANLDLREPIEYVPVEPNQRYHFHAIVKTEGVTTENGISFLISDPNQGAAMLTTENLTGSHAWTPVDVDYTTSPRTHFHAGSRCFGVRNIFFWITL